MLELSDGTPPPLTQDQEPSTAISERTKMGISVLTVAIGSGVLGNFLLRETPWGINVFVWCAVLIGGAAGVLRWREVKAEGAGRWMAIPALVFAGCIAWRASDYLIALNLLAVCIALGIGAFRTVRGQLWISGIAEYLWAGFMSVAHFILAPLLVVLRDIDWAHLPRGKYTPLLMSVIRGAAIALPILFIFGGLLMAADAAFENIMGNLFQLDIDNAFSHLFFIGFWTWFSIAFFSFTAHGDDGSYAQFQRPRFARIGMIETGMVLGTLNLLFATFVVVQFRYFFGGAEYLLQETLGLTLSYAEYARRGFFELVTVAALLLPLLLGTHWLMGGTDQSQNSRRMFVGLAGFSVVMMFVMIASALMRMTTYTQAFGLTELRLYTTAFMGWLAVLFTWFSITVLRGRRANFAVGALATGFATLLILNVINPDALITQTNIARSDMTTFITGSSSYRSEFDASYITTLSEDAVPPLIAALDTVPEESRCSLASSILNLWQLDQDSDWRSWNWGRWQAQQAIQAQESRLLEMRC
jgi:hypothetical protein